MSDSQISPDPNVSPSSVPTPITSTGLRQFLDISPDALITVNQAGMIMMVNSQAEILFGYPREELLGQRLEILLPQRFRKAHIAHREHYFSAPLARPMGAGLQLSGRRKDGMEFPVDISLRPLLLDGVPRDGGAIRDVTEQKMLRSSSNARTRNWMGNTAASRRPIASRASFWPTCPMNSGHRSMASLASPS